MSYAQNFVYSYIETYKDIAIFEMDKSGIPASITLAQGMLESNWGRSDLAINAKNHFGIKCGNSWQGDTFQWEDDEYKRGQLVKSCFRVYSEVQESFKDHSDFLSKKRYQFLFKYHITNYKSWAKGLVKAGYATDSKYADKLILIIEKYGLYEFDSKYSPIEYIAKNKPQNPSRLNNKYNISYINNCKVVYSKAGDTPKTIAKNIGVSVKKILKYNDGVKSKNHFFKNEEIVYLEKKKKRYQGLKDTYITSKKESLAEISQKFGVSLKYLAKINKTRRKIKFRKGRKVLLKPKSKRIEWVSSVRRDKKYLFDEPLSPKK